MAGISTSTARAWIITRRDGQVFGFTDHDRPLVVAGVTCEAAAALTASEATAALGLSADELDASGGLSSATITESDIATGRWDGARVSMWEVDWQNTAARELVGKYTIGEIERAAGAFRAELRSRAAGLDRSQGRAFLNMCDASLGDGRCRADLTAAGRTGTGTVAATPGPLVIEVYGLAGVTLAHMARGLLRLGGANAGLDPLEIRAAARLGPNRVAVSVWRPAAAPIALGDAVTLTVGCDKTFATCAARFGNIENFRGCPHMPGNDSVTEYAVVGDVNQDGGSRFA